MPLSTLNAGHYMKCTLGIYNDHRVSNSCVHCGFVPFFVLFSSRNCVLTLKPTRILCHTSYGRSMLPHV